METPGGSITVTTWNRQEVRIQATHSSRSFVEIRRRSSTLDVESGGALIFENVRSRVVEAGSVGGRIVYDGTLQSGGHYFFGSHGGSITLRVPPGSGAAFHVATIHGSIHTDLPEGPEKFEKGRRHTFRVGDGSATVEAETFGGRISILRREPGADGRR